MDERVRRDLHEQADGIRPDVDAHLSVVLERSRLDRRLRFGGFIQGAVAVVLLLVAIPLVLVLSARFPGGTSPSPSPTANVTDLLGSYSTVLADAGDVHAEGLAGTWALEFRSDDVILLTPPSTYPGGGQPLSGVSYSVTPRGLRTNLFSEQCGSVGVYGWQRSGDSLILTPDVEDCDLRRVLLASRAWQPVR